MTDSKESNSNVNINKILKLPQQRNRFLKDINDG